MTEKRLAYSVLVSVLIGAACSGSNVKKPKDSGPDFPDLGTGGAFATGGSGGGTGGVGTGGAGTGGVGTGGVGTGGAVVEPPAVDAGPDAMDASPDGQPDATPDSQPDAVEVGSNCGMVPCAVGDKRCATGGLQTCVLVNGCPAWGAEMACGANRTCTGTGATSACTCNMPPAACTSAGTYCVGMVRHTCEMVNGCLVENATTKTCGTHQTCTGGLPNGDCACNMAPAGCSAAGTFCPTTTTVGTCTQDSDGCFTKSGNDTTCMNGQVCVASGATAACACPMGVGTTVGTGCTTLGQTICSGDTVLTCTMNATSSCKTWVLTTDCAGASGLTCGTRSGPAACECPAATGGNYYVDPVAGSDGSNAAPFPSGAKSPAACRFKTLSKAANVAVTSGNKIIAITTNLPGVFTESTPLNISAGVTLTTDDVGLTPSNYRLDFTGSAGAAVVLANGSAVSGFTIANANTGINAANPAVGISCTVGTVTVSKVNLVGVNNNLNNIMATGLQIGIMPVNSCTGTFSDMTIDGFNTGVFVSTSAGVAPKLERVNVLNSSFAVPVGVLVQAGTLNSTDLVVQPSAGIASSGYGVVVRPGSNTTVANFIGLRSSLQKTGADALWLDDITGMQDPQATLTDALVSNPTGATASGINVESGTLNIAGSTLVTGAGQYGLSVSGGTVVATGADIAGGASDGVHVTGGSVTLHNTKVRTNGASNIFVDAGTLVVDDGSAITFASGAGILYGPSAVNPTATVSIGANTGATVDIANNGGHGISLAGTGGTNSAVTVRHANIHDNSLNGVNVALTANGSAVTVANSDVYSNHVNGVVVTGAPSATATNSVILDTVEVRLHTGSLAGQGRGIWLNGNDAASDNITATLQGCKVHDNRAVGIQIDEDMPGGHTTTTREILTGNDVHDNNLTGLAMSVGGISFATSSTLSDFQSNKLHHNGGDQIAFTNPPTTGATWDINAPGTCGTAANQIYCYTLPGAIGLRATAPNAGAAYTVDAAQVFWSHAPLTAGTDFVQGANTTVTTGGTGSPCTPAITTCP